MEETGDLEVFSVLEESLCENQVCVITRNLVIAPEAVGKIGQH